MHQIVLAVNRIAKVSVLLSMSGVQSSVHLAIHRSKIQSEELAGLTKPHPIQDALPLLTDSAAMNWKHPSILSRETSLK
jgi:hypothetical protein